MASRQTAIPEDPGLSADRIRRAQAGDESAFGELMQEHYGTVFRLVFGIVRDEHSARDVCQEVWLKVWQNLRSFRGDSRFTTWIHPIAVRRAIDHLRKRRRWYDRFLPLRSEIDDEESTIPAAPEPVATEANPDEQAEADERKARFERALASLPPKHRAVLALREVEGLSYEQIAKAVNCRPGTVMSRLYHARRMLVRKLGELPCE